MWLKKESTKDNKLKHNFCPRKVAGWIFLIAAAAMVAKSLRRKIWMGNEIVKISFAAAAAAHPTSAKIQLSFKANEIVDETCSSLPDSVDAITFPLHMNQTVANIGNIQRLPLIWFFDSGVMLKTEYLSTTQMNRFANPGAGLGNNIWEVVDERLMMKAVGALYHRCGDEDCVFVDGGAAFGYYSQMIRIHFPLVRVLAFNPHPSFVMQMIDNLSVARVTGVCLQQRALSDSPGVARMAYGTGGRLDDAKSARHPSNANVAVATLDDYYDDFGEDKLVVAVKLDIEGHGGKAIRGGAKMMGAARNVFVGVHNHDEAKECANLESVGFTILDKSKFPSGFTPNGLCVATRNKDW